MIGTRMQCAAQRGHGARVMLSMYGAWIEGSTEADIAAITRSMEAGATAEAIHGSEVPIQVPPKGHQQGGMGKAKLAKR
jgi:hypothetical protein